MVITLPLWLFAFSSSLSEDDGIHNPFMVENMQREREKKGKIRCLLNLPLRPEMSEMLDWLDPLNDWEKIAYELPGITDADVGKINIDGRDVGKMMLFGKWLRVGTKASMAYYH
jgi:hypothetical protein